MISKTVYSILLTLLTYSVVQIEGPGWLDKKDPCADDGDDEKSSSRRGLFASKSPDEKLREWTTELFQQGKFAEAIPCFNKLLRKFPDEVKLIRNRGVCYMRTDRIDLAIVDYVSALEKEPNNAGNRFFLAEAYYESGKMDLALKNIEQAYKDNPTHYEKLAILSLKEKINDAIKKKLDVGWPQEGKQIKPEEIENTEANGRNPCVQNDADGKNAQSSKIPDEDELNTYGNLMFTEKKYEEAERCYSKAIELKPEVAMYYRNRGSCYLKLEKMDLTIADFKKSLELEPQNVRGLFLLGQAFFLVEEIFYALENIDEALLKSADSITEDEKFLITSLQAKTNEKIEEKLQKDRIRKGKNPVGTSSS